MAFTLAQELQRLGVSVPLSVEYEKQAHDGEGNVNRLLAIGVPVALASRIAVMFDQGDINQQVLVACGMPSQIAVLLSERVGTPPVATSLPIVSGRGVVGIHCLTTNAFWQGTVTIDRAWQADGVDIAGSTSPSYTPVVGDVGKMLRRRETATNPHGSTTVYSNSIGPVFEE